MATNDIWSMTPEELLEYFKGIPEYAKLQYEVNPGYGRPVDDDRYAGYDAYGRTKDGRNVNRIMVGMQGNDQIGDAYMETPIYEGYQTDLAPVNKDGFFIGGDYDEAGNLIAANRLKQDTGGWFGENIDWLAPLLIGGMAFAGAGGLGSLGAGGATGAGGAAGAGTGMSGAYLPVGETLGTGITASTGAGIVGGGIAGTGLTLAEMAGQLGMSEAAVSAAITDGTLPSIIESAGGIGGGVGAPITESVGTSTQAANGAGGIGDLLTLKNAGTALRAAGLISALTGAGSGSDGGGGGSKGVNLIADHPITRTTNPVEYVTPQQAADYIKGKYTGTTPLTAERKYFNYEHGPVSYTNADTGVTARLNPETGQYETINNPNKNPAITTTQEEEYVGAANGGLMALAHGGGVGHLGGYSDGGRLLRGPGDGVSDSIPATIGEKQPARLADGEFVIPARIVSELGNGSSEAGARQLYAMMDRIQKARRKSMGKGKIAKDTKARKLLPA